jgi:glycosyltransferase involved in cell wall biosynthesis
MNIGLIIGRFPPDQIGGAELQIKQLAAELAQRGHKVTVFTRRYSDRPYREKQDGYLIRRRDELPVRGLRIVWDNFPAVWQIAQLRSRLQVLLCYQTMNSGLIGVIAQALLGIPAIISVRGNKEYRLQISPIYRVIIPLIYRQAQHLIVQSPRMQEDLHTQLKMMGHTSLSNRLRDKVQVIPNGVRAPFRHRSSGVKVLYVGRLIKDKGIADLLRAMRALPGVETLIVGDGPEREQLETLAVGMPVTFTGQVAPSAVFDYLQQARVLVLPSYRGDGLPNVILEAMTLGVPVVATRIAAIPDIVEDAETGYLFEPGDIQQMITCVDRILSDDDLWERFSRRSIHAVRAYTWEVITPQIERLLLDVVSR